MESAFRLVLLLLLTVVETPAKSQSAHLTIVELNCENLFDCRHDSLKQDTEFLPGGVRRWTRTRYWRKLNNIAQEILSCSAEPPDLVALCEVENDTVLCDLTRRSLLRNLGYEYLMTESADVRGIDVALLYQPTAFRPLCYDFLEVPTVKGMRPTRDILYVRGLSLPSDTLHLFILHAPSRYGGEKRTRPFRMQAARVLSQAIAAVGKGNIIVTGDFNDYADSPALHLLEQQGLTNITQSLVGKNGGGNFLFHGDWHSLDHVLLSHSLVNCVDTAYINDAPFLLEEGEDHDGPRPRRTFNGYRYQRSGFSDHLPLVVRLRRQAPVK